ncbi:Tudor domain-containing protein [Strongyloides ratti]|uniref:Tudor domain-containing protein n=1 Tax=Strongyloides ratti TaxID=34506 RepID=A0A090KUX9_STRRB|nr:Tudor domain-containing protein [Strongyloides ratti]CEF61315.1 Tudor domain-containing protein [Strongyloides ratti]
MDIFGVFEDSAENKNFQEESVRTLQKTFGDFSLKSSSDFSVKRYPLRIPSFTSNNDDHLYDFETNTLETKISKKDMVEFQEKVSKIFLRNSGVVLPQEKVTPSEIHAKLVRHNDVRWGDTVTIVNVISPHLIFVRRPTSTYKNFQFHLPYDLEKIQWVDDETTNLNNPKFLNLRDCVGYYVLAPLMEDVYVRARIIEVNENRDFVKVIYIDHGSIAWLNKASLAVMDTYLFKFRWQIRPIALNNIYPYNKNVSTDVVWNHEQIEAVKDVLSNYSLYKFYHYERLKRLYAADIVTVELFQNDGDTISSSINEILIHKYNHLFYKIDTHYNPISNVLIDISHNCDEKLDISSMPLWKLNFPPPEKISRLSNNYTFIRDDGISGFTPDFWTVKKLKDNNYFINDDCLIVFLQSPMNDSHPLRLGGYLISSDKISQLREKAIKEGENSLEKIKIRRLLSELCHETRKNIFEKLRKYGEQYNDQCKDASITLDDLLTEWENDRPFYIVTERLVKDDEYMFFRAEVTGFYHQINYSLLRIRYLDFNGSGVCCMHEAYKLSKYLADDMPFNIGFYCEDIIVKNENITEDNGDFRELVNNINEKLPFGEPILIKLNLNDNKEDYPNKNIFSNFPMIIDSMFQTDFKIRGMWKINYLDENGIFATEPIKFNNISQKYNECFKEKKSLNINTVLDFYTRENFNKFKRNDYKIILIKFYTNI